ncbi:MAG: hypothetical protein M3146_10395 [Thermoproteota archaeon]|nr:hypothetical protein [Thermoproteota archaeon]
MAQLHLEQYIFSFIIVLALTAIFILPSEMMKLKKIGYSNSTALLYDKKYQSYQVEEKVVIFSNFGP